MPEPDRLVSVNWGSATWVLDGLVCDNLSIAGLACRPHLSLERLVGWEGTPYLLGT